MKTLPVFPISAFLLVLLVLTGCGTTTALAPTGTLQFRANGEDFIRRGFVSKDGWRISFDHVYVTLANLTAYQSDPPFDPDTDTEPQAGTQVSLAGPVTVDLAAGDADADPILVGEVNAPGGRYNALAWELVAASDGPASGAVLQLVGTATRAGRTIPFTISFEHASAYRCGDYVGDERKGLLDVGGTADLEATFHFDHLFGDGEAPPDAEINTGALGFEPFAALARDDTLNLDQAAIEAGLTPENYATLLDMHLAHVGEGHCRHVES
jgi:hypothetical protein